MIIENEDNLTIPSTNTDLKGLKERIMPFLKAASEICEVPAALISIHENSDIKVLASYGACDEPVVSAAKKISDILDPDDGLSIIQNVREHEKALSRLSDLELNRVQFYAGALFRSETEKNIG